MHYIIGTRIAFNKTPPKIGASSGSIKIAKKPAEFEYGTIYALYNIKRSDDKFVYSFRDSNNSITQIEFDSITAADTYIAKIKMEELPDYDSIYARNTS